jgi:hypothetical protein
MASPHSKCLPSNMEKMPRTMYPYPQIPQKDEICLQICGNSSLGLFLTPSSLQHALSISLNMVVLFYVMFDPLSCHKSHIMLWTPNMARYSCSRATFFLISIINVVLYPNFNLGMRLSSMTQQRGNVSHVTMPQM